MKTRGTLAAILLGTLIAGCGHQSSPRASVASYLKKVNRVEAALARPLGVVTTTGTAFAREQKVGGTLTGLLTASHEQALLGAKTQITGLRNRLAAMKAPPAARHLRALLLQICDIQARLTGELAQLVAFLPSYAAAMRPLAGATLRLELALSQRSAFGPAAVAAVYARKSRALRDFKATAEEILTRLRMLHPPPVSRSDYVNQIAALRGMSLNAGRLADVLGNGPQGNVQQLLLRFDQAAATNQTVAAQRARIAAVRAYDNESTTLLKLGRAAERERLRLANNLA